MHGGSTLFVDVATAGDWMRLGEGLDGDFVMGTVVNLT